MLFLENVPLSPFYKCFEHNLLAAQVDVIKDNILYRLKKEEMFLYLKQAGEAFSSEDK